MLLGELIETSRHVSETPSRLEKIGILAGALRRLAAEEIPAAVSYLSGALPQDRPGLGPASLRNSRATDPAASASLTLAEVDRRVSRIAATAGAGSSAEKNHLLQSLMACATREEQEFLTRLILGDLRQGALEGVMVEAVARAAGLPAGDIRRALMVSGDLGEVARVALVEGGPAVERYRIRLFRPVQPMLAQTAGDVFEALERLGAAAFEHKMDGARVQVHKSGDEVRLFTRRLNEVTSAIPEIVESVRALPAAEIVLDGEILALRKDGRPHPFQTTMRRFGRRLEVLEMRETLPVTAFFFDCLLVNGESLIDHPSAERFSVLSGRVPEHLRVPRLVTADAEQAERFLRAAVEAGHEGVMAKSLDAPYEAGSRGTSWLKLKRAHTLDLVVLAAEWGSGRRQGWLSNLHLGARDPGTGGFVMLGKTFKGMTDEILASQTRRLQELEISRDRWTVYVRPELVVEVAFNDIQSSPHYPGGLALRFARLRRYRPDKSAGEADTIDTIRAMHQARVST